MKSFLTLISGLCETVGRSGGQLWVCHQPVTSFGLEGAKAGGLADNVAQVDHAFCISDADLSAGIAEHTLHK
jgi:hypothetical protein